MKLMVKAIGGAGCEISASGEDRIDRIKEAVSSKLQVDVKNQKLIFEGRTLQDSNFVRDYKLKEGSKIHLILSGPKKDSSSSLVSPAAQKGRTEAEAHKDIYSALRKYFKTEEEARRVTKTFEEVLLRKLSYLSLDDIERLCTNLTNSKKIIF